MKITDYFDKIILIHLERRTDRWEECVAELDAVGLRDAVTVFKGHDMPGDGNRGCTASHRGVLELIGHHGWERTLILEDDFKIVAPDFHGAFEAMIGEVPADWEMLYLGGHYQEGPQARVSPRVLRIGRMMTTSSYAVTLAFARRIAPWICGIGPIDTLYYETHMQGRCYICQPRLMVQRAGFSDLQQHWMDNGGCMMDGAHEAMV